MNQIKKPLTIGVMGLSFALVFIGMLLTNRVFAFNSDDAEDVVYTMYSGAVVYDVDYDKFYDEYEVFFESDEYEYGSSVIVDKYGDIVDEILYYREDEDEEEEW